MTFTSEYTPVQGNHEVTRSKTGYSAALGVNLSIVNTVKKPCQLCPGEHKMSRKYLACKCQTSCTKLFRVEHCDTAIRYFEAGIHAAGPAPQNPDLAIGKRGLDTAMKERIEPLRIAGHGAKKVRSLLRDQGVPAGEIPDITQVQNFFAYKKTKAQDPHGIQRIVETIQGNLVRDLPTLGDATPVYFGFQVNDSGLPILGNGLEENHLNVGIATKESIRNYKNAKEKMPNGKVILHVDGTFKTNVYGYQIFFLAFTDISHKLTLFGASLMSHKSAGDYVKILNGFKLLVEIVTPDVQFNPAFVMMDAEDACRNAFQEVLPQSSVVMCFQHVKANVEKRIRSFAKADQSTICIGVHYLHYSVSEADFNTRWEKIKAEWIEAFGDQINPIINYFQNEWISGIFCNWRIFDTPPGYCKGNNSLEGGHRGFKLLYTGWEKLNISSVINAIGKSLRDNCADIPPARFSAIPTFPSSLQGDSRRHLVAPYKLRKITLGTAVFYYSEKVGQNGEILASHKMVINADAATCTCRFYLREAFCSHIFAAAMKFNIVLPVNWPDFRRLHGVGRNRDRIGRRGRVSRASAALNME